MLKDCVEYGILGVLIMLSIVVVALIIERIIAYKKVDIAVFTDKKLLEIELTRNLTLLATIGTNAPYIGLLGTVGGIMLTFLEISQGDLVSTSAIMSGLALALKATALGLVVAIPAIVGYNLLLRKSEVILSLWDLEHNLAKKTHNTHPLAPSAREGESNASPSPQQRDLGWGINSTRDGGFASDSAQKSKFVADSANQKEQ